MVNRVEAVLRSLDAFGGIFHEIGQHSPIAGIRNGLQRLRENGCDTIVAVGGGSPIDASKAILYFNHKEHGVGILPQIAIPTTLSAAEYTVRPHPFVHFAHSHRGFRPGHCRIYE